MPPKDNKAVVEEYLREVWDKGNFEAIGRFLSPDYKRYTSPRATPLGPDGQIHRLNGLRVAFPDVQITIERMAAEGDLVAIQGKMRGTHLGEFAGIPPTEKEIEVGLTDLIRLADSRFIEHWGGPDMADLRRQLLAD